MLKLPEQADCVKLGICLAALSFAVSVPLFGQQEPQYRSQYSDIPIVDVHVHPVAVNDAANFIKIRDTVKEKCGANLAFWVGMSDPGELLAEMKSACNNRILFAVNQKQLHKGLTITSDEIISKIRNGYVGMKFWFGPHYRILKEGEEGITRINDPRFADFFAAMEREKVLMTSMHIADPNGPFGDRGKWVKDPVYFWEQIRAFENVIAKYPKLTFIAAHGSWLVCQDAQIDYLRYLLSTYPNLHVDISATFQYMPAVNRDNLRDFYVGYQDRILYGTDGGSLPVGYAVNGYINTFAILETDETVKGSFFGDVPVKGLDLPREVLEKIYYKNALKLYPGLKEAMGVLATPPPAAGLIL
ncbi:MAG: amidohydrolase [Planctomycetaceae bacterium]|nr:amidohydrolase [Planctomycetaceae bacterium]